MLRFRDPPNHRKGLLSLALATADRRYGRPLAPSHGLGVDKTIAINSAAALGFDDAKAAAEAPPARSRAALPRMADGSEPASAQQMLRPFDQARRTAQLRARRAWAQAEVERPHAGESTI